MGQATSPAVVTVWTGAHAKALQTAMRMTGEQFAEWLGVSRRAVAVWRARPGIVPRPWVQELLDRAYHLASDDAKARFAVLTGEAARVVERPTLRLIRGGAA